ncbi:MAG TPA: DUF3237 family protein [Acidimicrobiales bacterium]|nr:DUF3237 family protein [Acidimicrobiales bacterium]
MLLEPLYQLRYRYLEGWQVAAGPPETNDEAHFYVAEGRCDGRLTGRFGGANHPRRRGDRAMVMDMQGVIETDDGATVVVDVTGYGRAYPAGRRQVVGAVRHLSDDDRYRWLNDAVAVLAGEVRTPDHPPPVDQAEVELVFDVAELIWEAPAD